MLIKCSTHNLLITRMVILGITCYIYALLFFVLSY